MTAQQRFQAIYEAHASAVYGYALRRTDRAQAEDIVAEVFLVVWRRLEDVPAEPRGWLLGVARRVAANSRRGEERRAALAERLATELPRAGEPAPASARLADALLSLPERDREALTLISWDGLSRREAAQALGIREGTLAVRLLRARRRLARALERAPEAHNPTTTAMEAR